MNKLIQVDGKINEGIEGDLVVMASELHENVWIQSMAEDGL